MSRLLLASPSEVGHLLVMLAACEGLVRRGHEVLFYGTDDCRTRAEQAGARFIGERTGGEGDLFRVMRRRIRECEEAVPSWLKGPLAMAYAARTLPFDFRRSLERAATTTAEDMLDVIRRERVDAVFADTFTFGARYAAELGKMPFASLTVDPVMSLNARGTLAIPVKASMARVPPKLWRTVVDTALPLGRVRRRFGLRPQHFTAEFYSSMFSDDLLIVAAPAEICREPAPEGHRFVGPMVFDPPRPAGTTATLAPLPDEFALVSGSSDARTADNFVHTLRVLSQTGYPVVATAGDLELPDFGPQVHILRGFAPHSLLVPKASMFFTHGGWGASGRALRAGTPLVITPRRGPQFGVATRLSEMKLAVHLPLKKFDVDAAKRAIDLSLKDVAARRARESMRARLLELDSPLLTAEAIERLIAEKKGFHDE